MATPTNNEPRLNDRIRAREVRLIGPDGAQIGIKPLPEALSMARDLELDLVEVADKANPPVCRIMDYRKYEYQAKQRAKESRRKASSATLKEMKYRPKIGPGDFDTKTKKVEKFLEEGHKVKVTIMFRGREMTHPELGRKILDRVATAVSQVGKVEIYPRQDGRNMTMVLAPDKKARDQKKREPDGEHPEPPEPKAPTAEAVTAEGAVTTAEGPGGNGAAAPVPEPVAKAAE